MNNIQIFNNPILGDLRTVIVNGKEYFFGVDIASMLMYKRPRKAVQDERTADNGDPEHTGRKIFAVYFEHNYFI